LQCHRSRKVRLYARNALCTVYEGQLSTGKTRSDRVQIATDKMFAHWLGGLARSRGTKSREDSLCSRFNINDPRTNSAASVSLHSFRHWPNTAYSDGGLSRDQMSIVFNRESPASSTTYIHTSASDRTVRLKEATRDGTVIGDHVETYKRIAEESQAEASLYLEASLKFYSPMPHGLCTLNMSLEACPHTLSCFSRNKDKADAGTACEHLIVDPKDKDQHVEIRRINKNAVSIIKIFERDDMMDAPQYRHYKEVKTSTDKILLQMKSP